MSSKQDSRASGPTAGRQSIARILEGVASDDDAAIQSLWDEYFCRLVRSFRSWYGKRPRPVVDEEDLALDVLECVRRRAHAGAYREIATREEFWKVARRIGWRKLIGQRRHGRRLKRGGKSGRFEAVENLDAIPARAESVADPDELQPHEKFFVFLYLEHYGQPLFWTMTQLRLEGISRHDMAKRLNLTERAVDAKFRLMFKKWRAYVGLSDEAKRLRIRHERELRQKRFDKMHKLPSRQMSRVDDERKREH